MGVEHIYCLNRYISLTPFIYLLHFSTNKPLPLDFCSPREMFWTLMQFLYICDICYRREVYTFSCTYLTWRDRLTLYHMESFYSLLSGLISHISNHHIYIIDILEDFPSCTHFSLFLGHTRHTYTRAEDTIYHLECSAALWNTAVSGYTTLPLYLPASACCCFLCQNSMYIYRIYTIYIYITYNMDTIYICTALAYNNIYFIYIDMGLYLIYIIYMHICIYTEPKWRTYIYIDFL